MWILLLLVTCWAILAFVINRQRQALMIITFLATGGFQLLPIHWFWSPLLLVKPYDYAFVAMGAIFLLRAGALGRAIGQEGVAKFATGYMVFLLIVLLASIAVFSYSPVQSIQSARVFFWPAFLLLFLLVERADLERFIRSLYPIVVILSVLYLLQPITGKTIINPSGEYFNPYVGATDMKRFLSTPDFLVFFLLLAYHRMCVGSGQSLVARLGQWTAFVLFAAVQVVSLTRSAILATGAAVLYLSKRLLNPLLVIFFVASVAVAATVAYSASSVVEGRVDEAVKDISSVMDGRFLSRNAAKDGNLSFRLAHVNERLGYVLESVKRWPMGIGFIHEDSAAAQNLGFKIGLPSYLTGRAIQVDSGDIAWSVVVIKTGLGGLALLLVFLMLSFRAVGHSVNEYAVVYRGALIVVLMSSFFSSNLVSPNAMLPLMLFLAIALRAKQTPAEDHSAEPGKVQGGMPALRLAGGQLGYGTRTSNQDKV